MRGEGVRCNVCGRNFKKFRWVKTTTREMAMCPWCGSFEFTRTLWFYLNNEILGRKNKNKFLYFAPEKSIVTRLAKCKVKLDLKGIEYLNTLNRLKHAQKLKGGFYDVILFPHLLEYVYDDLVVLEELLRLLRPGGIVLVMTIVHPNMDRTYENINSDEDRDRLSNYYEKGVKRIYGSNFYKHLLKAGFDVEIIDYADQLGDSAKAYYQLGNGDRELIFKCKKIAK